MKNKFKIFLLVSLIVFLIAFLGILNLSGDYMVIFSLIFSYLSLSLSAISFYITVANAYKNNNKKEG